ncbi:MAG: 50S ribosomal protein L18 [bacterium]
MVRKSKREAWASRKRRVRKKIKGTPERPRLSVYRSGSHIYAQIIDDVNGKTLVQASSLEKEFQELAKGAEKSGGNTRGGADLVGKVLGDRAKAGGVQQVVFDRTGYHFHGRVKALADGVRGTGVKF